MGWALLGLGALLAFPNWMALFYSVVRKKHVSMVGPLGGIAMLVGAAMLGRRWGMLLALIDPGVLSILMLPPYLVMEAIRTRRG
jgi:hypothetical protein